MRRLLAALLCLASSIVPKSSEAAGKPEVWSHGIVNVVTGEVRIPIPLPSSAGYLRQQLANPTRMPLLKRYVVHNTDGSSWEFDKDNGTQKNPYQLKEPLCAANFSGNHRLIYDSEQNCYQLLNSNRPWRTYEATKNKEIFRLSKEEHTDGTQILYSYDVEDRLEKVEHVNSSNNESLAWLNYTYSGNRIVVKGSDSLVVEYELDNSGKLLKSGNTRYQYSENGDLIHYEQPDGYFMSFDYYRGKVVQIKAPIDIDETPVPLAQYSFQPEITTVTDAEGEVRYFQHHNGLVTEQGDAKSCEIFTWSNGLLTECTLKDSQGSIQWKRSLDYDAMGNVVRETLSGNLTGNGSNESYSTYFTYDDCHRVIKKEQDNGTSTSFSYVGNTDLVQEKWVSDDTGSRLNYQYEYNSNGKLTETRIQDVLTNQTRIFSVIYTGNRPLLIDEKYVDSQSNEDKIQKTTIFNYDGNGRVQEQHLVDGDGMCFHTTRYAYDQNGNISSVSDDSDNIRQYRYDSLGRVIQARDSAKGHSIASTYDYAGRLVSTDLTDHKKRSFHQSHRYDKAGRRIATVDIYGNETRFLYDQHGRLIQTIYPAIAEGIHPTIQQEYDSCDRITKIIDPNGHAIHIAYNIRGNPTHISYADGTEERFEYSTHGTLLRHIAANGVITDYTRDFLARVVEKTLSGHGEAITSSATYDAFQLVNVTDPLGRRTSFERDSVGRVASTRIEWDNGSAETHFNYDSRNQITSSQQWFGYESNDFTTLKVERNHEGQTIACKLLNAMEESIIESFPTEPTVADGQHVEDDHAYINHLGQRVLRRTITSEHGITSVTIFNALGHAAEQSVHDSFGNTLSTAKFTYDPAGHVAEENYDGNITRYSYGPFGRLQQATERADTSAAATTHYEYNDLGQLVRTIRPDDTCLEVVYDGLGRIERLSCSDNTIDYEYQYDAENRPVKVIDHISGLVSSKEYHALGKVTKDMLANGIEISKYYDRQGRLVNLTLPDDTAIEYVYDAARLTSVHRLDAEGTIQYSHHYKEFSEEGRPTKMTLPANAGSLSLSWDKRGYLSEITSKWWSQRVDLRDDRGSLLTTRTWDTNGRYISTYAYDTFNRLIAESGVINRIYSHDAMSNRVEGLEVHPSSDHNGNVSSREINDTHQSLRYDALNRLVEVQTSDHGKIQYTYDAFGRRLSKTTWKDEDHTTIYFLYDDDREIGAVDEEGNIIELRILGTGLSKDVGAAIALELDGELYIPIHDCRGNLSCLLDTEGSPVECYRFGAYGEELLFDAAGSELDSPLSPWRFSSKRVDRDTTLIHFGCRDYDPYAGRWLTPDPLGTADGPNRHAFVHNNPLAYIDPQGLFSIPTSWQDVKSQLFTCLRQAAAATQTLSGFGSGIVEDLVNDIMDDFRFVAHEMIGPSLFLLAGLGLEKVEFGVVGNGEFNNKVRVSHVNGVLNNREAVLEAAQLISKLHGGVNVHYTFRPTAGWTGDLLKIIPTLLGYTSPTARRLAEGWRELIDEVGGVGNGGLIIHYAHSLGGAETACAKRLMEPEELRMIRVTTFGSAKMLPNEGFLHVKNYISSLDLVMFADAYSYFNAMLTNNYEVSFLRHQGILFVDDHKFCGPIYSSILEELGRRFVALYDPKQRDSGLRSGRNGA